MALGARRSVQLLPRPRRRSGSRDNAEDLKQAPELLLKSDINNESLTAFCEKQFPDLEINPHWLDFIIENVHAGETIKTIGDIAHALERTTELIEEYRRQRPDLFKYSTDFVTKALGFYQAFWRLNCCFIPPRYDSVPFVTCGFVLGS